jgi:hypothetical protein
VRRSKVKSMPMLTYRQSRRSFHSKLLASWQAGHLASMLAIQGLSAGVEREAEVVGDCKEQVGDGQVEEVLAENVVLLEAVLEVQREDPRELAQIRLVVLHEDHVAVQHADQVAEAYLDERMGAKVDPSQPHAQNVCH